MKKLKFITVLCTIALVLFGSMFNVNAASSLPDSVVSDGLREVEYIENFPVIVKTAENGKYYIYCINMSATYAEDIEFTKTGTVDPGYIYILNNKPNTGDKDKDFYITQMAVWYYEDYLNQNNFNLVSEVKKYIIKHKDTEEVSKLIYQLYDGAKNYQEKVGSLSLDKSPVTFTISDGYYVSSEIKVYASNLDGNVKYSLSNAPVGSKVVKSDNGVKVKIPVDQIPEGKKLTVTLNVEGSYTKYTGYYYFHSSKYQKVLFQEPLEEKVVLKDSISMTAYNYEDEFEVEISKTDITQSNEVPGATLVVKDEAGNVIDTWVSTNESHKLTLKPGKYSLTETIAPEGYKLSKTTIEFLLDNGGSLYVKNEKGVYEAVDRVIMINELIDVVGFAKKDSKTDEYVSGATLVIKDENGNVVKEFVTTDGIYQLSLDAGYYTLSEVSAPEGYVLSKEVIYFRLMEDGTLQVKNEAGEYSDSAIITFYNTKKEEEEVEVPATGLSSSAMVFAGIVLLTGGAYYVKKTIKEC